MDQSKLWSGVCVEFMCSEVQGRTSSMRAVCVWLMWPKMSCPQRVSISHSDYATCQGIDVKENGFGKSFWTPIVFTPLWRFPVEPVLGKFPRFQWSDVLRRICRETCPSLDTSGKRVASCFSCLQFGPSLRGICSPICCRTQLATEFPWLLICLHHEQFIVDMTWVFWRMCPRSFWGALAVNDVVCFKIHTNKHGLPGCLREISHQNQWVLLSWLKEMAHKSLRPQASAPLWKRIGYSLSVLVRVLKMLFPCCFL